MYNLKGGKILQDYPSLARICHLFYVVRVLRIVTFRFASKYHFSFCIAPTFRFAGLKIDNLLSYLSRFSRKLMIYSRI